MGKNRQRHKSQPQHDHHSQHHSSSSSHNNNSTTQKSSSSQHQSSSNNQPSSSSSHNNNTNQSNNNNNSKTPLSLFEWCYLERHGLFWVTSCAILGMLLGLGIGTGHLTGSAGKHSPWRSALASKIRSSFFYEVMMLKTTPWSPVVVFVKRSLGDGMSATTGTSPHASTNPMPHGNDARDRGGGGGGGHATPGRRKGGEGGGVSHPAGIGAGLLMDGDVNDARAFNTLREMVVREKGGYVHPDLGLLIPAPSGAGRGLGMISDAYYRCQSTCFPPRPSAPVVNVTIDSFRNRTTSQKQPPRYDQTEILVRIPLDVQMTRIVALQTLLPLLSHDTRRRAPLEDLDDAALLVLLLAHERGRGRESRFQPYVASLPKEPTCGYSPSLRSQAVEIIQTLGNEMGLDVNGWPAEITKAADYAERIAGGLTRDYGNHIAVPRGMSSFHLIQWGICQVASRATAGRDEFGSLRLVPIVDLINHDADAGGMVELKGDESISKGDFIDATEDDAGTFIIRSLRHGRRKPLRKGQELLVNYNVPQYSPLDWFISLGFVPPERSNRWVKIDAALPRVPRGLQSNNNHGNHHAHHHHNMNQGGMGAESRTPLKIVNQPRPEL